jgi:hypothetical protein
MQADSVVLVSLSYPSVSPLALPLGFFSFLAASLACLIMFAIVFDLAETLFFR